MSRASTSRPRCAIAAFAPARSRASTPIRRDRRLILVRISLDRKYPVTPKTVARMGHQGLTGLAYIQLEDDGTSDQLLEGKGVELPRIGMKPSLFETLSEKGGDIATQLSEVATRVSALLNEKNVQNLSRTIDNVATASEGFKEMPQVVAAMREMLSDTNLKRLNARAGPSGKGGGRGRAAHRRGARDGEVDDGAVAGASTMSRERPAPIPCRWSMRCCATCKPARGRCRASWK